MNITKLEEKHENLLSLKHSLQAMLGEAATQKINAHTRKVYPVAQLQAKLKEVVSNIDSVEDRLHLALEEIENS